MYISFIKLYCNIIRPLWSKIRWSKSKRINIVPTEKVSSLNDIQEISNLVFAKFKYKYDDLSQLFDSIKPPSQAYEEYKNGLLEDDCDGFHSVVYHILVNNNISCYLLTLMTHPLIKSHTVLLFNYQNSWYILDYNYPIHGKFNNRVEAIDYFSKIMINNYGCESVDYINLLRYEYGVKGQYRVVVI